MKTGSGATGRFGCGLTGGRLVVLVVVSQESSPEVAAPAFEELAAGLELN